MARTKEQKSKSNTLIGQTQANREYKSSVFAELMSLQDVIRETYYALKKVEIPKDTPIEIITLSDVFYLGQLNDVAFKIGNVIILLLEHQSTQCPNIPVRIFIYLGREYEKVLAGLDKEMYGSTLVQIPRPEFYVLYNGKTPLKNSADEKVDFITYKLSDMFADADGAKSFPGNIELEVPVYDINDGHNKDILDRSETLRSFAKLIAKVREFESQGNVLETAIKLAVGYCIANDILRKYLESRGAEVLGMLFSQLKAEDMQDVWARDGKIDMARNLLLMNYPVEDIAKASGLSVEKIKSIRVPQRQSNFTSIPK